MPHYIISIKAFASAVVKAKNESEAMRFADEEISLGDLQHDETYCEGKITESDLESSKRRADKVIE